MCVYLGWKVSFPPRISTLFNSSSVLLRATIHLAICILPFSKHTWMQIVTLFFFNRNEITKLLLGNNYFFHLTVSHEQDSMSVQMDCRSYYSHASLSTFVVCSLTDPIRWWLYEKAYSNWTAQGENHPGIYGYLIILPQIRKSHMMKDLIFTAFNLKK